MASSAISGAALVFLSQSPPSGLCFLIFWCLPVGASQNGVWTGIDRLVRCPSNFEFCREGFCILDLVQVLFLGNILLDDE